MLRAALYRLVEQHYEDLAETMAAQGKPLPAYVEREFEDYLKCGRLEHGFLRVRYESCHAERLVALSSTSTSVNVDQPSLPRVAFCKSTRYSSYT